VCLVPAAGFEEAEEKEPALCGMYEHNEGEWRLDASPPAQPPPPCCGWDKHKWGGPEHGLFMYEAPNVHVGIVAFHVGIVES